MAHPSETEIARALDEVFEASTEELRRSAVGAVWGRMIDAGLPADHELWDRLDAITNSVWGPDPGVV